MRARAGEEDERNTEFGSGKEQKYRGYSSEAEPQPSKLMTRVRFPLPAPSRSRIYKVSCLKRRLTVIRGKRVSAGKGPGHGSYA